MTNINQFLNIEVPLKRFVESIAKICLSRVSYFNRGSKTLNSTSEPEILVKNYQWSWTSHLESFKPLDNKFSTVGFLDIHFKNSQLGSNELSFNWSNFLFKGPSIFRLACTIYNDTFLNQCLLKNLVELLIYIYSEILRTRKPRECTLARSVQSKL